VSLVRLRPFVAVLTLGAAAARPAAGQAAASTPKVTGYLQPRFESVGDSALFFLRRVRVAVQGDVTPWASYRAQVELRNLGTTAAVATVTGTDLYLALRGGAWSGLVGQYKVPFSLEALLGSSTLELADRSIIVGDLAPNRDIGASAEWHPHRVLAVRVGAFNGEGPNHATNPDRRLLAVGRVVLTPATGLELGGAAAAYRDSTWLDADVYVRHGAWTLRSEYLRRKAFAPRARREGWYALGAYRLPHEPIQIVGRVEQVDSSAAPGDRVTGYTAGAQYLFRGDDLKLQASYATFVEQGPAVSNNRFIVQMQVRW
jgi:phosphate-selective porin